jgi:hypothetical protein
VFKTLVQVLRDSAAWGGIKKMQFRIHGDSPTKLGIKIDANRLSKWFTDQETCSESWKPVQRIVENN